MPKRIGQLDLVLASRDPSAPATAGLAEALRGAILEGRLRPGARLPSTRSLAAAVGLSRGTVVHAFEQLASEGYLVGAVGAGTYVSKVPEELLEVGRGARPAPAPRRRRALPLSSFARRARPFPPIEDRPSTAFRANLPALDLFPVALWARLAGRHLRRAPVRFFLGSEPFGDRSFRAALADYLRTSRGVRCEVEQVVIVAGVQEALDLAAHVLLDPGGTVAIEDPGYVGAHVAFEAAGARLAPVPVDDEGMMLDAARLAGARLAYVTPGHQFPLGVTMSLARRLALLDWARRARALIVEDDYDSEFRYRGRPLPSLQGLDREGRVLYAGSFSKVLAPALRLGYLVVPDDLVDAFAAARSARSHHPPLLDQAIARDFLVEGHFGRHLRRMREVYAERLGTLLESAASVGLERWLALSSVEAGLQTSGWLAPGLEAEAIVSAAAARGVEVTPLGRYALGRGARQGLQLGFAAVGPREIRRGVRELAALFEVTAAAQRRTRTRPPGARRRAAERV